MLEKSVEIPRPISGFRKQKTRNDRFEWQQMGLVVALGFQFKDRKSGLFLIFICPCIANIIPNYNQQDATFLDLFISTYALHVSGDSSAHRQEHITVHTASGIVNQYFCLLLTWMRWKVSSISSATATIAVMFDNT